MRILQVVAELLQFTVDKTPVRMYARETAGRGGSPRPAVVFLHGAGGNLDFWASRFGPLLEDEGIALYAPHYFDRTGTSRADLDIIRDGIHVPQWLATVRAALRFVASRPGIDPERIVLIGLSLGGFLGLAFAAQISAAQGSNAPGVRAVVAVSGGLVEPYASVATENFPPTLILHGQQDTIVPVRYAVELEQKLTELNVAHRIEIFSDEDHWFSSASLPRMLMALSGFLEEHLAPAGGQARGM